MTNKFKTLLKASAAVATLFAGSQSWGAQIVDDAAPTLDLKAGLTFIDKHTYTPDASALLTIVKATLPDKVTAVVNDASDKTAAGSITTLEIKGSGSLTLQALGSTSTIATLIKSGKGKAKLILGESFVLSSFPEFVGGATSDELVFVAGADITLTVPAGQAAQNLVIDPNGYTVTLATATHCPVFIGAGEAKLAAATTTVNLSKIKGFKGTFATGAAITTISLDR